MKIELSDKQARVIIEALDLYMRVGMGQLGAVAHHLSSMGLVDNPWEPIREFIDPMKEKLFGFSAGANNGITSPKTPEVAKIAYEIEGVIRKDIAIRENHSQSSVWRNDPLKLTDEPFPKILVD